MLYVQHYIRSAQKVAKHELFETEYSRARKSAAPPAESREAKQVKEAEAFRKAVARQRAVFNRISQLVEVNSPERLEDADDTLLCTRVLPTKVKLAARGETPAAQMHVELFTRVGQPAVPGFAPRLECGMRFLFQPEGSDEMVPGRTVSTDDIALHERLTDKADMTQANIYRGYFLHGDDQPSGLHALAQMEEALQQLDLDAAAIYLVSSSTAPEARAAS